MAQAASCQWTAGPPTAAMSCPPCERRGLQQPQQDGSVLKRLPRAGAVTRQGKTKRQDRATRKDCGKTKNRSLECRSLSSSCGLRNLCICCCLCNFVFVSLGFVGVLKLHAKRFLPWTTLSWATAWGLSNNAYRPANAYADVGLGGIGQRLFFGMFTLQMFTK
jgi:hypothetical protein